MQQCNKGREEEDCYSLNVDVGYEKGNALNMFVRPQGCVQCVFVRNTSCKQKKWRICANISHVMGESTSKEFICSTACSFYSIVQLSLTVGIWSSNWTAERQTVGMMSSWDNPGNARLWIIEHLLGHYGIIKICVHFLIQSWTHSNNTSLEYISQTKPLWAHWVTH